MKAPVSSDREPFPDETVSNGSLADSAYLRLREEIISVELPPGTLLREDELRQPLRHRTDADP